jgi:hypothetical protein
MLTISRKAGVVAVRRSGWKSFVEAAPGLWRFCGSAVGGDRGDKDRDGEYGERKAKHLFHGY